ncbi:hypothetical protein AA313_de0203240 [Arthrobotrys entomopaga]|nr:hypothetical protein AA313_de0203240 [Arthrobotrys entomopaga]
MLFTAKISGIPDMLLSLRTPGARGGGGVMLEAPVFHPCVRLSKWNAQPGQLSFVPPDGKFVLASYEVNMLPTFSASTSTPSNFQLPVSVTTKTLQGPNSSEFEVRMTIPSSSPYCSVSSQQSTGSSAFARIAAQSGGSGIPSQFLQGGSSGAGSSSNPVMEDVSVFIPLPPHVRNLINTRASKGDFIHDNERNMVHWRVPNTAIVPGGSYTFKAEVVIKGSYEEEEEDEGQGGKLSNFDNNYEAGGGTRKSSSEISTAKEKEKDKDKKLPPSAQLIASMPRSVLLDFTIRGALLSGLKVDSLNIVGGKGLPETVKPYKGVKYLSRAGDGSVEIRC